MKTFKNVAILSSLIKTILWLLVSTLILIELVLIKIKQPQWKWFSNRMFRACGSLIFCQTFY